MVGGFGGGFGSWEATAAAFGATLLVRDWQMPKEVLRAGPAGGTPEGVRAVRCWPRAAVPNASCCSVAVRSVGGAQVPKKRESACLRSLAVQVDRGQLQQGSRGVAGVKGRCRWVEFRVVLLRKSVSRVFQLDECRKR